MLAGLAEPQRWVHLIAHGNPPDHGSLYSGIWLPAQDAPPLLLAFPEIAAARAGAELVVLSACGDARWDQRYSGSRLRVAEALLHAGVGMVVASANPASDAAAAYWTPRFYAALAEHGDVAHATREARALLRSSPHFRHPRHWAGLDLYVRVP